MKFRFLLIAFCFSHLLKVFPIFVFLISMYVILPIWFIKWITFAIFYLVPLYLCVSLGLPTQITPPVFDAFNADYYWDQHKPFCRKLPSGKFILCASNFVKWKSKMTIPMWVCHTCPQEAHLARVSCRSPHVWAEPGPQVFWLRTQCFSEAFYAASINNFANVLIMLLIS